MIFLLNLYSVRSFSAKVQLNRYI